MKKLYFLLSMMIVGLVSSAQTTCTSNGGNNWATAFNCTGSGTPVVYVIQAGDSVNCDVTTGIMIDSMIIEGKLNIDRYRKIDMALGGVIQVYSGATVTASWSSAKFRFNGPRGNLSGPMNVNGEAWSTGSVWIMGELPVTFVDVTAVRDNDMVNVNWTTAAEINNSHFEVEVSFDQTTWETMQVTSSQAEGGFSYEILEYSASLNIPSIHSNVYVRIKQIDFDGAFDYSEIKRVETDKANPIAIEQMEGLKIAVRYNDPSATIQILDVNGRTLVTATNEDERVEFQATSAGVYMIEVKTDRTVEYQKVIIQ